MRVRVGSPISYREETCNHGGGKLCRVLGVGFPLGLKCPCVTVSSVHNSLVLLVWDPVDSRAVGLEGRKLRLE